MKHKIKQLIAKRPFPNPKPEESLAEAINNLPRITNETVAEHREEVLGGARKYIYPLQHSRKRIVIISISIVVALIVAFFAYTLLALYKFIGTSTFLYRVTQVLPFPVAKAGPSFVSYENYLFQLRHYIHYYQTQQKVDFGSDSGKQQFSAFRKLALSGVINDAYIKQLAKQHNITVSDAEVNDEVALLRNQNRLGSNEKVFEDVLKQFWGWSVNDFKRELRQQILAQKVNSALDTETHARAQNVLSQLQNGGNFADLAKQYSDDPRPKANGGDYGIAITKNNRDLSPQVIDELFKLQPGQKSGIIETPTGLEIVQVRERDGDVGRASHIFFQFQPITKYIDQLKATEKTRQFITV